MNCKADYAKFNKQQSAKRLIALLVCVLFIAGAILSTIFIFTHINHEHDPNGPAGGCVTCVHLTAAENLLKHLSAAIAGAALIFGCFSAIRSIFNQVNSHTGFFTLVCLKVRLNN